MTVIRNNSISGINSITAQSGALNFYDSTGNTLSIGASVSGNITGDVTGNLTGNVTVATGATISGSTNTITASTNGSERLRITSDGKVGVGEDNVQAHFHVAKNIADSDAINWTGSQLSVATPISGNSTANRATIYFAPYGSDNNYAPSAISASAGTSGASTLKFFTNASGNLTGQVQNYERLRITSGGDIQVANGNLVFSTAGTGIDFSATSNSSGTMSSELLDDYEEGTWSPTYTFGTTDHTSMVSAGTYVKVGKMVFVTGYLYTNNSSTYSGTATITGLPFAIPSGSDNRGAFAIGQIRRFNEDMPNIKLYPGDNGSSISMFRQSTNSNGVTELTNAQFNFQSEYNILSFSGSYATS